MNLASREPPGPLDMPVSGPGLGGRSFSGVRNCCRSAFEASHRISLQATRCGTGKEIFRGVAG